MLFRFDFLSTVPSLMWDYFVPLTLISLTGALDAVSRSAWLRKVKPFPETPWKEVNCKEPLSPKDERLRIRIICDVLTIISSGVAALLSRLFIAPWILLLPSIFLANAGCLICEEVHARHKLDRATALDRKSKSNTEK